MPVLRDIFVGAIALLALAPARAAAGDLGLAGTPVVHQGEVCLTRVDRSVDPIVHLDYTIPSIDTCLGPDEPPDGRTHQFIGFCHDAPITRVIPPWLTRADLEVSHDLGLLDPDDAALNQDVLEDSSYFAGCWRPIQPADARRPITCAAARPGVDWDTSGLPTGAHVVSGYTYSPPLNHWQRRRGVYRIHDGDLDAAPPAAAIFSGDLDVWSDEPARLAACVDAPAGATATAEYAVTSDVPDSPLTWQPFLPAFPAPSGALELEFTPTPELAGQRITFRLIVSDLQGRSVTAHMPGKVFILSSPAPDSGGDAAPVDDDDAPYDFCRSAHADDPPKCSTSAPAPDPSCSCTAPGPAPAWLYLLALATRRRRRR